MDRLAVLRAMWVQGVPPADGSYPPWPSAGVAIEGDFSGIQKFVLRPVPGAGGAARRLRARSFRVLALTRLVARAVEERFRDADARLFYSAGGRFVVVGKAVPGWSQRLADLQCDLDRDLLARYRGELVFHLAGTEFTDGRVPRARLREIMSHRRSQPFADSLQGPAGWNPEHFVFRASEHGKCGGCGATASLTLDAEKDEEVCQTCRDDRELGKGLLRGKFVGLARSGGGSISLLGETWAITPDQKLPVPVVSHSPRRGEDLATFEDLAGRAKGRPYIAYLRIDADRIGDEFGKLDGTPAKIWGLSKLLDMAFSRVVSELIAARFPNLYPVYGGGDDLFVIGPWSELLEFSGEFRERFREISGGRLSFSAGMALAKPRQHILTKSEEAEDALRDHAKKSPDSIHALGRTIPWREFPGVMKVARELAELHSSQQIRSALLQNLLVALAFVLPDRAEPGPEGRRRGQGICLAELRFAWCHVGVHRVCGAIRDVVFREEGRRPIDG